MKSEICPIGTEDLLSHLGYHLNALRTRWEREGDGYVHAPALPASSREARSAHLDEVAQMPGPDDRVIDAMVSERRLSHVWPQADDVVMTDAQVKYRKYQAIAIRRFGNNFFKGFLRFIIAVFI